MQNHEQGASKPLLTYFVVNILYKTSLSMFPGRLAGLFGEMQFHQKKPLSYEKISEVSRGRIHVILQSLSMDL